MLMGVISTGVLILCVVVGYYHGKTYFEFQFAYTVGNGRFLPLMLVKAEITFKLNKLI